jgi:serine/threonine-protein kinase
MGAVYEVEHVHTGEHLALKVLLLGVGSSPDALERFKREARASALINSENVVRVIDADIAPELGGAPFLVMDLLEGTDLERVTTADGPAPTTVVAGRDPPPRDETAPAIALPTPATVVEWLTQVARAVDKAHRLGIVHRDLKPGNLFLTIRDDGRPLVKILDFGIVKLVEERTAATNPEQILGTPEYMAPEQASSNAPVTPATDRCALGLIAYRLLTGQSYYQGGVMSILGQLLHGQLQPPSERGSRFGGAFDAWFLKACNRDPQQRFASASEQIEALSAALGLTTIATETARRQTSLRSRGRVVVAVLAVVGLAAASLAGVLLKPRPSTSRSGATSIGSVSVVSPLPPQPRPPASPPAPVRQLPPEAPVAETRSAPATLAHRSVSPRPPRRHAPDVQTIAQPFAGTDQPKVTDPYADQD